MVHKVFFKANQDTQCNRAAPVPSLRRLRTPKRPITLTHRAASLAVFVVVSRVVQQGVPHRGLGVWRLSLQGARVRVRLMCTAVTPPPPHTHTQVAWFRGQLAVPLFSRPYACQTG